MQRIYESLASVTVVRELYDSGRDIYDVLANYLKLLIASEHINDFSCAEITERLNRKNSFKLNESVVKTALKRLNVTRDHGIYMVDASCFDNREIDILDIQEKQNKILLENLYGFIQRESPDVLTEEQKEMIQSQFYGYLLNEDISDEYSLLISRYIMEISADDRYMSIINRIKEGVLIYEGICYSSDLSEVGKWTTNLNIYLELEILFYIAGYNGELHKSLYHQLLEYIDDINADQKSKEKYINLYYTQYVKEEIEGYFRAAERAFEKREIIDPARKPMLYILKDARSKSDIQTKKIQFYNLLSGRGILPIEIDFYSPENQRYSKVDESVYKHNDENIETDKGNDYVRKCTDKINQIEILRKNNNIGLKDIKHILLTANGTILKCAYSKFTYHAGEVPKATVLDFLVDRLWFELNKGFGKGKFPKTIDMVSRARMALSLLTTNKISKVYDEIKEQFERGEITQKEVTAIISELRKHPVTPDEINVENLEKEVSFLKDYDISRQIEEMKREELERSNDKEKIVSLETKIEKMQEEKELEAQRQKRLEEEHRKEVQELKAQFNESQRETAVLNSKIQEIVKQNEQKRIKAKKIGRSFIFGVVLIVAIICFFYACKFLFKLDDSLSGLISIILTVVLAVLTPIRNIWKKFVRNCN